MMAPQVMRKRAGPAPPVGARGGCLARGRAAAGADPADDGAGARAAHQAEGVHDGIVKNADNVGERFANERRKMHYGDKTPPDLRRASAEEAARFDRGRHRGPGDADLSDDRNDESGIDPYQQRHADHISAMPEIRAARRLLERIIRHALREQHLDSASVRTWPRVSANARNQNCEANAPMKPASMEGRHRPRIALSILARGADRSSRSASARTARTPACRTPRSRRTRLAR